MKKIRINELARELEIKAHDLIERLPELGVTEKKTHSSSIDEDVAIRLRRLYGEEVPDLAPEPVETEAEGYAAHAGESGAEAAEAQPAHAPAPQPKAALPSEDSEVAEEAQPPVEQKPPVAEEP